MAGIKTSIRQAARSAYFAYYRRRVASIGGVSIAADALVRRMPLIEVARGATVEIGAGALLNSSNPGYHLNMHSPVKLLADRAGARIRIGALSRIHGACIHAYESVQIGQRCLIAANCQIMDCSGHDIAFDDVDNRIHTTGRVRPVVIEDSVWLGAGVYVMPGVRIGRGSVVGAGSVVTRDVPPMVVAAGNPAQVVRRADDGRGRE